MKILRILTIFLILTLTLTGCQKLGKKSTGDDEVNTGDESPEPFGSLMSGSFILTNGSLNGGATLTLISATTGEFVGSCYEINKKAMGVDYDGVISSNSFTGRFSNPKELGEFCVTCTIEDFDIEKSVGVEEIVDGKKQVNMSPVGIQKAAQVTFFYPGAKTADMPQDFLSWAKNSYYFEGDTMPVTGLMISANGENYGWILQEEENGGSNGN